MAVPVLASSSSSGTGTVAKPTGTASGDYLYALIVLFDTASYTITAPSGWTLVDGEDYLSPPYYGRTAVYKKIAGGSEPVDYTWTSTAPLFLVGHIYRVTGASSDAYVKSVQTSGTVTSFASITTTSVDNLILLVGAAGNAAAGEWATVVPSGTTASSVNQTGLGAATFTQASAGATGTKSTTQVTAATAAAPNVMLTIAIVPGADTTAPTITSGDTFSIYDSEGFNLTLTANESVTWSIRTSADQTKFGLSTNNLYMLAKNFYSPTDSDADNVYVVIVRATDAASNYTEQTISVTVTEAPVLRFMGFATGTTSVTMPTHKAGDLLVAFAYRDGSNTLPTLGSGWTSIQAPTGANTNSARLAYIVATGTSHSPGTWTSTTSLIIAAYRPRPGLTLSVGASTTSTGTATSISYPTFAFQDTSGNSWGVAFGGHRSTNTTVENPPTGMIYRGGVVDATDEAAMFDTNGGVTGWAGTTVALGGTASGWVSMVMEIKIAGLTAAMRPFAWGWVIH